MSYAPLAFLLALGGASALALLAPGPAVQPGQLLPAHAALRNDCAACHRLVRGVESARCRACHPLESIGRSRPGLAQLHAPLGEIECFACHAEHAGRLGRAPAARFRHELIQGSLREECDRCHAQRAPADELHAASAACGACHTTRAWQLATYDHTKWFRFDKDHPARCGDCHAPGSGFKSYTCATCHPASKIAHEHDEVAARDLSNCVECHRSGDKHEAEGREHGEREERDEHEGREEHGEREHR
jgi:hypothetical protein